MLWLYLADTASEHAFFLLYIAVCLSFVNDNTGKLITKLFRDTPLPVAKV